MTFSTTGYGKEILKKGEEKNCSKCMHYKVCKIIQVVGIGLGNTFKLQDDNPIEIHDLAKICKAYTLPPIVPNKEEMLRQ